MGFFHALGRILGGRPKMDTQHQDKLLAAWHLDPGDESALAATAEHTPRPAGRRHHDDSTEDFPAPRIPGKVAATHASAYDLAQWHKKLKSILADLPDSQGQWKDLMGDVGPLGIDANWIAQVQREEFTLLLRRAVADQVVTEDEHARIELARRLVGLTESEAEDLLHKVVAEAESFFGKHIEGTDA
jgi:hypothetical protein